MLNLMKYNSNDVEIIKYNDKVLFNPYDVGNCLDMKEETVRYHIRNFNENQVIKIKKSDVGSTNNLNIPPSGRSFLTESGVYKLSFKSRKPEAEKFTDWVTDEVLPSIRKTGKYEIDGEQLELEPYKLEKKTYKGKPVMTVRDIVYLTGQSRDSLNWTIKRDGLGLLLQGRSLEDFREENNFISKATRRINILYYDDVYELTKKHNIPGEMKCEIDDYFNDPSIPIGEKKIKVKDVEILQKVERLKCLYFLIQRMGIDDKMKGDMTEIISERYVEFGFLNNKCRSLSINSLEGWNFDCVYGDFKRMIRN
ncbi:hypothetical protein HV819_02210 [Anaerococcus sp. AGMB00486]|uniref:Bro-N domain-containing protein n=2 Tax=Anaerococcus TaxID=165779 RepID=A0ABX2N834_9FIRM|nr:MULTISPECIES: BRO family protein [Anaerococcus]MSS77386.1 hypothetical protein [Anaerococcus porci]NVF10813.1 hypothetical protein [Anaerococcus faecalis]